MQREWTTGSFIGRQALLTFLDKRLSADPPQSYNLVGIPGVGKSAILDHIKHQGLGAHQKQPGKTVYISLPLAELAQASAPNFWRFFALQLQRAEAETGLASTQVHAGQPEIEALYRQLCHGCTRLISEQNVQRIVVLIDNGDVMAEVLRSSDLNYLRALGQRFKEHLAFVVASWSPITSWISDDAYTSLSPLISMFAEVRLNHFSQAEAATFVCLELSRHFSEQFIDAALPYILREAGRHPRMLAIACRYVEQNFGPEMAFSPQQFQLVQSDFRMDSQVKWLFTQLLHQCSPGEKLALNQIRQGEKPNNILFVRRLERHLGVIEEEENGRYQFTAEVFYSYLQSVSIEAGSAETPDTHATFEFIPAERRVRVGDEYRMLTRLERRLLSYLLAHANKVCSKRELLENVWQEERTLTVVEKTVNRLRHKIEVDPKQPHHLLAARGEGYVLRL